MVQNRNCTEFEKFFPRKDQKEKGRGRERGREEREKDNTKKAVDKIEWNTKTIQTIQKKAGNEE